MEDNGSESQKERSLKIVCPSCKAEKELLISESIISQSKNLTTISIQKDEICEHHFQAFVDKDFKIRGYQKVDFEIVSKKKFPKGDYIMKVILLGDYKVGKTSITRRFVVNEFEENYLSTLHMEISKVKKTFGETNSLFEFSIPSVFDFCFTPKAAAKVILMVSSVDVKDYQRPAPTADLLRKPLCDGRPLIILNKSEPSGNMG